MMKKSRLLYSTLLAVLATAGSLPVETTSTGTGDGDSIQGGELKAEKVVIWERVEYIIVEKEATPRRIVLETLPESTAIANTAAGLPILPKPTTPPQKRQNDGQIQALSGQIAQLSVSFQSASSASQSISQSAQQVQQSADQASRENSQALSRTQSSASSAVSQASQQANDRISQASSSMSSQISRNLASVQSSASSAISVAQASASSSMASAVNVAMSQIQAVRAEATAARSDANNFADQVQKNAISTTNLAIIVATSVSGAVILTSIVVCVFLRYRRKRREPRDYQSSISGEKGYDKPIAVRGSTGGSRFNPFSGGRSPVGQLKLPTFSPQSTRKDEALNFGFAMSDYSDLKEKPLTTVEALPEEQTLQSGTAAGFRLQKPPAVQSAEAVRVIRVNSKKDKKQADLETEGSDPPPPQPSQSARTGPDSTVDITQTQFVRKPVAANSSANVIVEEPTRQKSKIVTSTVPTEPPEEGKRYTASSEISDMASSRYTMISTATTEPGPESMADRTSRRYTVVPQPESEEEPGWRPPSSRGASRANSIKSINTAQRLAFRDSGDSVPEPNATGWKQPKGGFSMASVSNLMRSDSADIDNRQPTIPQLPKRAPKPGPSFAAFPVVRNGPPSVMNRPRPELVGKIRQDAERRLREKGKAS